MNDSMAVKERCDECGEELGAYRFDLPDGRKICAGCLYNQNNPDPKHVRQPVFWGSPDDERLEHSDEDEAIEAILDEMGYPHPDWPETITICGFARMEVDLPSLNPLEDCLDRLDEEYGDPDGEPAQPTEAMKEAERVFLETIRKEYTTWACEEVCRKEISVAEWVKENRPDWLQSS